MNERLGVTLNGSFFFFLSDPYLKINDSSGRFAGHSNVASRPGRPTHNLWNLAQEEKKTKKLRVKEKLGDGQERKEEKRKEKLEILET